MTRSGEAFLNKRGGAPDRCRSIPSRHQGGDRRDGSPRSEALGVGGAASRGDPQRRLLHVTVICGFGSHSALGCRRRPSLLSLLADMPFRRVFRCSVAASNVALTPSGFVPGVGADGRGVETSNGVGGGGLDGFFSIIFEVLFVKCKDLGVILFSSVVLYVVTVPTV